MPNQYRYDIEGGYTHFSFTALLVRNDSLSSCVAFMFLLGGFKILKGTSKVDLVKNLGRSAQLAVDR